MITTLGIFVTLCTIPPNPLMPGSYDSHGNYVPSLGLVPLVACALMLVPPITAVMSLLVSIVTKRLLLGGHGSVREALLGPQEMLECHLWSWESRLVEWFWYNDDIVLTGMLGLTKDTLAQNSMLLRPLGAKVGARSVFPIRNSSVNF